MLKSHVCIDFFGFCFPDFYLRFTLANAKGSLLNISSELTEMFEAEADGGKGGVYNGDVYNERCVTIGSLSAMLRLIS